jgi:hypothetical protein
MSNRVGMPAHQAGNRFLGSLKGLRISALDPVLKKIGWEATLAGLDIHYFILNPAGLNSSHTDSLVTIVHESIPPG